MGTNWKRAKEVVWEELDGEALLVNPKSGASWSLNATASMIWKLCDGTRGLGELASSLAKASGRSASQARREVAEFCERIAATGLLSLGLRPAESEPQLMPATSSRSALQM